MICLNYLDCTYSPPAASAPSVQIYGERMAIVEHINLFFGVGNPVVPCSNGGIHHGCMEQVGFCTSNTIPPSKFYICMFRRVSPKDSMSQHWYGHHLRGPYFIISAGISHGRQCWGIPLGVYFVSPVRNLIIYVKFTVILLHIALHHYV